MAEGVLSSKNKSTMVLIFLIKISVRCPVQAAVVPELFNPLTWFLLWTPRLSCLSLYKVQQWLKLSEIQAG